MSDTNVQECNCCGFETDCINGLCEPCSDYNYKLQKQSDLLTLGLLQEKNKVSKLVSAGEQAIIALCSNCSAGDFERCHKDTRNVCAKGKAASALQMAIKS